MADEQWVADEPRLTSVAPEVMRRGMHRPVLALGIPALVAGAFVASSVLRPPVYEATLHFRIVEGELADPQHAPRAPSGIREYIRNVAMSRDRVEQILAEHPSFGSTAVRNRERVIEEFRDDVDIEVSRNQFLLDWIEPGTTRSARVAMSLRATDGAEALAVLHEIADAFLEDQAQYRVGLVSGTRDFVEAQLQGARARVNSVQRKLGRLKAPSGEAGDAVASQELPRIAELRVEASVAAQRLVEMERLASAMRLAAAAERDDLGLTFQLFDESVVPRRVRPRAVPLAGLGTMVFGVTLLFSLLFVGSFDGRVYSAADLAMRGIPVFGSLPRFPGDDVWTYRGRSRPGER